MSDDTGPFNLFVIRQFLDVHWCNRIIDEMNQAPEAPAVVYGTEEKGTVNVRVRKVTRIAPPSAIFQHVIHKLQECMADVGKHFGRSLDKCEEPQFLRYLTGDYFVAHQDGNTGLLLSEKELSRKVSVVIFLNSHSEVPTPSTFAGGSLVFTNWRTGANSRMDGQAGTLVAFPAETTHEVIPVTRGQRFSIVSWFG